ncbi:lysophospholipid acyltransferase family protein [Xanthovirga aplysinae]|uniref:lysophospholipid acyltransferase family protein n=1 Tax=Xanthovirga aplysinae TaxID=2529853 RepID=UPI0012BD7E2D|nr:lysophospholipid acyltransferase family protein [Xanthovirga aplysinae]MTI31678.1 hypothetical protein [Xanthovirga aplysinae]
MILLKLLSRFPFWLLYAASDFLYFLIYYLIGYRKSVVMANLTRSFPEKDQKEIKLIAKKFYKNLTDLFVEVIKGYSISEKDIRQRMKIKNPEIWHKYYSQGQSIIVMTSHQANWEWLSYVFNLYSDFQIDAVYQTLHNKLSDRFMKEVRSHLGTYMIEKRTLIRQMVERRNLCRLLVMVSDQGPQNIKKGFTTHFLGQDTTFFFGAERIALKNKMPVMFVAMKRVKRGHYETEIIEIDKPPFQTKEHYITKKYIELVEQSIRENPSDWLWSHRRWKHNIRAEKKRKERERIEEKG